MSNVTVIVSAVGDTVGETNMFAAESAKGGFSGLRQPSDYLNIKTTEIAVPMTTLDQFKTDHGLSEIDFMKVDVEGAEMMLVAGAEELFSTRPRPVVQFEFADGRNTHFGYLAVEPGTKIEGYDYSWYEFSSAGLKRHVLQGSYSYTNLAGVPDERLNEVDVPAE